MTLTVPSATFRPTIGELYRADRFAAPAQVWPHLQYACPDLFDAVNA